MFSDPIHASLLTVDSTAPAASSWIVPPTQDSDTHIGAVVAWPDKDSDGSDLDNLKKGYSLTALENVPGESPFLGLSPAQMLAIPGVQVVMYDLTVQNGGQHQALDYPVLHLGDNQHFAVFTSDTGE